MHFMDTVQVGMGTICELEIKGESICANIWQYNVSAFITAYAYFVI